MIDDRPKKPSFSKGHIAVSLILCNSKNYSQSSLREISPNISGPMPGYQKDLQSKWVSREFKGGSREKEKLSNHDNSPWQPACLH